MFKKTPMLTKENGIVEEEGDHKALFIQAVDGIPLDLKAGRQDYEAQGYDRNTSIMGQHTPAV